MEASPSRQGRPGEPSIHLRSLRPCGGSLFQVPSSLWRQPIRAGSAAQGDACPWRRRVWEQARCGSLGMSSDSLDCLCDRADRVDYRDPDSSAANPERIAFRQRRRQFLFAVARSRVRSTSRSGTRRGGSKDCSAAGRSHRAGHGPSSWRQSFALRRTPGGSTGGRWCEGTRGHTRAESPAGIAAEAIASTPAETPAGDTGDSGPITTPTHSHAKPLGNGADDHHRRQQQRRPVDGAVPVSTLGRRARVWGEPASGGTEDG
jgi:hypothetical protein